MGEVRITNDANPVRAKGGGVRPGGEAVEGVGEDVFGGKEGCGIASKRVKIRGRSRYRRREGGGGRRSCKIESIEHNE